MQYTALLIFVILTFYITKLERELKGNMGIKHFYIWVRRADSRNKCDYIELAQVTEVKELLSRYAMNKIMYDHKRVNLAQQDQRAKSTLLCIPHITLNTCTGEELLLLDTGIKMYTIAERMSPFD